MADLWPDTGYGHLECDSDGYLTVTADFLRSYYERDELAPIEESCDHERAMHTALMEDPFRALSDTEIAAIMDPDSRENYRLILNLRQLMVEKGSIENTYLSLFKPGAIVVPSALIQNMVQVIVQNILDQTSPAFELKSSELFFRKQILTLNEGGVLIADHEVVNSLATKESSLGDIGKMMREGGIDTKSAELKVLNASNSDDYSDPTQAYKMILDASYVRGGLDALCRVMEKWIYHFNHVEVEIKPLDAITVKNWVWHIGLDKVSSKILNDLYNSVEIELARMEQLISLFQLDFVNPDDMRADIRGHPVYMGLSMDVGNIMTLKPQNLLSNLPLANTS